MVCLLYHLIKQCDEVSGKHAVYTTHYSVTSELASISNTVISYHSFYFFHICMAAVQSRILACSSDFHKCLIVVPCQGPGGTQSGRGRGCPMTAAPTTCLRAALAYTHLTEDTHDSQGSMFIYDQAFLLKAQAGFRRGYAASVTTQHFNSSFKQTSYI